MLVVRHEAKRSAVGRGGGLNSRGAGVSPARRSPGWTGWCTRPGSPRAAETAAPRVLVLAARKDTALRPACGVAACLTTNTQTPTPYNQHTGRGPTTPRPDSAPTVLALTGRISYKARQSDGARLGEARTASGSVLDVSAPIGRRCDSCTEEEHPRPTTCTYT